MLERLRRVSENIMKKDELLDDLRPEYDLSKLKNQVRGKYAARYREGTNLVLLDPDVYEVFPDSKSVNSALKMLIKLARKEVSSHPR